MFCNGGKEMTWKDVLKSDLSKAPFFRRKPLSMAAEQEQNRMKTYNEGVQAFDKLMADKNLFKMIEQELRKQMSQNPNNPNYVIDTSVLPGFNAKYAPIFENVFGQVEDKQQNLEKFLYNLEARFDVWEVTMDYNRYIKFQVNK